MELFLEVTRWVAVYFYSSNLGLFFAPLEWKEYKKKDMFHVHIPLLLCGKISYYHRSAPFADSGVILTIVNSASL